MHQLGNGEVSHSAARLAHAVALCNETATIVIEVKARVKAACFNMALVCSEPFLLTADDRPDCTKAAPGPSLAALAHQAALHKECLLASAPWSFQLDSASWLPLFYVLLPFQSAGFLLYRVASLDELGPECVAGQVPGAEDVGAAEDALATVRSVSAVDDMLHVMYVDLLDVYQALTPTK